MSKFRYPLDDPHDIVGGLERENERLRKRLEVAEKLVREVNWRTRWEGDDKGNGFYAVVPDDWAKILRLFPSSLPPSESET